MPTVETVTTLETTSAKVGLVVMDCIMLDTMQNRGQVFEANKQLKVVKKGMRGLDCVELSEAMYFYEKATGKLGQSTYLR